MALLRQGRPDPLRRRVRPADAPSRRARGGGPGPPHAGLADPEGRGRRLHGVHRGRPPRADGEPRQRLLLRGAGDVVRPAGARRHRGPGLPVRAQGRRARDQPALRGRPPRARAHPRRRPHRRGRHPQRQDDRLDPAPARCQRRVPGAEPARGPRRGVPAGAGLRAAQRGDGGRRQADVRQPAQRGCWLTAAEGPQGHRDPSPGHGLPRHRCPQGLRAQGAVGGVRRPEGMGPADQQPGQGRQGTEAGGGVRRALRRAPARRRARDRRGRGQGRRREPPAPARLDQPRAAVGDRLQVPARGGQRQAPRDPHQHRPHRPGHAVRGDGADQGGRVDGRAGDAAQRPRGEAQGRAPGRHRDPAQGRRRDPRDPRPGARAAPRRAGAVGDADRVRVVRHHAGPGEGGRQGPALPQPPHLPGAAARPGLPCRRPWRLRHRGAGFRGGVRTAGRAG